MLQDVDSLASWLEAVPFGIAFLGTDLRYLLVNRAVCQMTGLPQERFVGIRIHDVFPNLNPGLDTALRRVWDGHATTGLRVSVAPPTEPGLARYLRVSVFPVFDGAGNIVAASVCSTEVTEQVLAEALRDDAVRVAQGAASSATRLYAVGRALSAARSVDDIAAAVAAECAQPLSARATGLVIVGEDGGSARFMAVEGQLPVSRRWATFRLEEPLIAAEVIRTGVARFDQDPRTWPERFRVAARESMLAGVAAQATVPMVVSGRVLGAMVLAWSTPQAFPERDQRFLETVAAQSAQALERVRLFEQQQSAAESLQRSLLPEELPTLKGIDTAAAYLPATEGLQVGGDWYDVMELPDGAVLLSLGDVAGSGVPAAVVMGQLRHGLRAIALREPSPARLLDWLEEILDQDDEELATLMLARLDPRTGEVTISNAGHLPPILLPSQGLARLLEIPSSPPLGVGTSLAGHRTDTQLQLAEGHSLVLYTDGLVEVRQLSISLGIDQLREAVDAVPRGPQGQLRAADLCEHVMVSVAAARERSDDVAVLVVHREQSAPALTPRQVMVVTLGLAGEDRDAARAREWVADRLAEWGLTRMADPLRLVVSEMVTNALIHAGGAGELRLRRLHDGVRVEVEDRSANLPRVGELSTEATGGRGLLVIESLADRWGSHAVPGGKIVWAHLAED
ncbi:MAG TPA: SpoIIE family protein phosphatase [Actinomycetes bacterium]|nr:SpoIIE family protein phosphatase [Actinomycetes bacterium]